MLVTRAAIGVISTVIGNRVLTDNCGVDALSKMIQVNQSLLHLNVTNSKMTPQHMHSIAKAMSFNHNILVLEIDHRNMKIKDSRKVADAIQRNRDLKKRQVRRNVLLRGIITMLTLSFCALIVGSSSAARKAGSATGGSGRGLTLVQFSCLLALDGDLAATCTCSCQKKQKVVEAEIAKEKQWIEKARRARMMERRAVKTQLRKVRIHPVNLAHKLLLQPVMLKCVSLTGTKSTRGCAPR